MSLRNRMIDALTAHLEGKVAYHKANVEIYLTNPSGIGEHPDVMEALTEEVKQVTEYQDILETALKIPREPEVL